MGIPKKAEYKFTYQDYCSWPDDERWELIDGIAYDMSPAPIRKHQGILSVVHANFYNYFDGKPCKVYSSPFDVFFPEQQDQHMETVTTVVQPDLSVICDKGKLINKGCFGAPDITVEILSPSTGKKDLDEKFHLYENSGVREYWVIDPGSNYIRIFTLNNDNKYGNGILTENTGTASSIIYPDLRVDLEELFKD